MHNLYYQDSCLKTPRFSVYKVKEQTITRHFSVYGDLRTALHGLAYDPNSCFLLDNNFFSFFTFDIFRNSFQPFSQEELSSIIQQKKNLIKKNTPLQAEFLYCYLDSIYIDGEKKSEVLYQRGNIFFKLYFVYIDDICLNTFRSVYAKKTSDLLFLPQSLYTILFVRNTMQRNNFVLLYITDDSVKAIAVRDGFYDKIKTINLGLSFLRNIYKDNGIAQYRNASEYEISGNSVALDLVTKSLTFYSQMLYKWLAENMMDATDIFLISSVLKNPFFIDIFNKVYRKSNSSNYIIPFHHSSQLHTFGKSWKPSELDVLIYLNKQIFVVDAFLEQKIVSSQFTHHSL